jgi:hypothetical protein
VVCVVVSVGPTPPECSVVVGSDSVVVGSVVEVVCSVEVVVVAGLAAVEMVDSESPPQPAAASAIEVAASSAARLVRVALKSRRRAPAGAGRNAGNR